jgi:hypothetical protein
MTSGLDICRTANVLVKHYGEDAALEAAQRADAMLEKGSLDGQRVWKRVLNLAATLDSKRQIALSGLDLSDEELVAAHALIREGEKIARNAFGCYPNSRRFEFPKFRPSPAQ